MCKSLPIFALFNTESRMASTFQLGDEQPALKPTTNLTKSSNNSFNNLFGPPTPAKVAPAGPMSGKMPTPLHQGWWGRWTRPAWSRGAGSPCQLTPWQGRSLEIRPSAWRWKEKFQKNSKLQKLSRFGRRRPPSLKDHLVETTASSGDWLCRWRKLLSILCVSSLHF